MKEKYYLVRVTEELSRTVKVEARDLEEARNKVETAYQNGEIVLDYDDFYDVNFYEREVNDEDLELYMEVK